MCECVGLYIHMRTTYRAQHRSSCFCEDFSIDGQCCVQRPCIGEIIEALVGQSLKTWLCALHRSNIRLPAVKDSGMEEELYVSRSRLESGAEVCKCKQRHVIEAGALNSWLACQTCRTHTLFVSVGSRKECAFSSTFELALHIRNHSLAAQE